MARDNPKLCRNRKSLESYQTNLKGDAWWIAPACCEKNHFFLKHPVLQSSTVISFRAFQSRADLLAQY